MKKPEKGIHGQNVQNDLSSLEIKQIISYNRYIIEHF